MYELVNWINTWAQGIIIAVIIGTIIEILLPENKNKKYIKTIIGIYILFTIISPIINKFTKKEINIKNVSISSNEKMNTINLDVNEYVEEEYKNNLTNFLKENGYNIENIELKINNNTIDNLSINISKIKKSENLEINDIKKVEINTSIPNENIKNEISKEEIEKIKDLIVQEYSISKEKIEVNG